MRLIVIPQSLLPRSLPRRSPPPPPPPPPPRTSRRGSRPRSGRSSRRSGARSSRRSRSSRRRRPPDVPRRFIFSPRKIVLSPSVLIFTRAVDHRNGSNHRDVIFSSRHNHCVGPFLPRKPIHHVTMSTALHTTTPCRQTEQRQRPRHHIVMRADSVHTGQLTHGTKSLVVFIISTSKSVTLGQVRSTGKTILRLLARTCRGHSRITLVPFQNRRTRILLPPAQSVTVTQQQLRQVPYNNKSPLTRKLARTIQINAGTRRSNSVNGIIVITVASKQNGVPLSHSLNRPVSSSRGPSVGRRLLSITTHVHDVNRRLLVVSARHGFISAKFNGRLTEATKNHCCRLPGTASRTVTTVTQKTVTSVGAKWDPMAPRPSVIHPKIR